MNDERVVVSRISLILTILVLLAGVVSVWASTRAAVVSNTQAIEKLKCDQESVTKLLYEIKLNLKNFMTQEGYVYQEVE